MAIYISKEWNHEKKFWGQVCKYFKNKRLSMKATVVDNFKKLKFSKKDITGDIKASTRQTESISDVYTFKKN